MIFYIFIIFGLQIPNQVYIFTPKIQTVLITNHADRPAILYESFFADNAVPLKDRLFPITPIHNVGINSVCL
jgi:hypothetical protein